MLQQVLLCFSVLILSVLCQDPIVEIRQTDPPAVGHLIEGLQDLDITMDCFVENRPVEANVRWQRTYKDSNGKVQVQPLATDTSTEDNTKLSIEKPTANTWRLRVKTVQISDEGNYTCFVYTTRQNRKEANMTITVNNPPQYDPALTSSDMVVKAGDTVDLLCNATGRPRPTIQWTRIGGALLPIGKESHFEPKLTIERVEAADRGTYRCSIFNMIGQKTYQLHRDIHMDVQFPPIVRAVNEDLYQAPKYLIELQCLVEANPFPREEGMKWIKGSSSISVSGGRFKVQAIQGAFNRLTYELIIHGVKEEDYGQYRCQIKNQEGMATATVDLHRSNTPQESVKIGEIVMGGTASMLGISVATFLTCLVTIICHHF